MEINNPAETPRKRTLARRAGVALAWFLAAMLALGYLSRAISEALKAEVSVGYAGTGTLDESVEGTGAWEAGESRLYTTYYTRRITRLYVRPGQMIAEGDPLFAYDVATVDGGKEVSDRTVRAAQKALDKAEAALENAIDPAYAQCVAESAAQALAYARFTHAQTYALQNGGVVRATFSGLLIKCNISAGKATQAGVTGFEIAPGGLAFTLTVTEKEAERIAPGDAVTLLNGEGREEKQTLTVSEIRLPDAEGAVTVVCEGDGGKERLIGAKQAWKIKKQSERYNTCVPLAALRQSGPDTYYVLLLAEKETILGTQLVAKTQEVRLLARDSRRAAVDAGLSERDKLITTSSKELKDGDFVVIPDA